MEVNYLDLVGEGYMGSMQWQLGREMGTIPAFASRTQENHENLGRDGRTGSRWDLSDGKQKNRGLLPWYFWKSYLWEKLQSDEVLMQT